MGKHEAPKASARSFDLKLPSIKKPEKKERGEPREIKLPKIKKPDLSGARDSLLRFLRHKAADDAAPAKKEAEREYDFSLKNVATIGVGALLFLLVWLIPTGGWLRLITFFLPYLLLGYETIRDCLEDLLNRRFLSRNFLILLASLGAFCIGEYPTAVFLMLLFRVTLMAEAFAREQNDGKLSELKDLRPKDARLNTENGGTELSPDGVNTEDVLLVQNGESIPADGMVVEGMSALELSPLTGYRQTLNVAPGSSVYSGMINRGDAIQVQVTAPASASASQRLVGSTVQAAADTPRSEQGFRYALHLLPACFAVLAVIIGIIIPIFSGNWRAWIYRALLLLTVGSAVPMIKALTHNISNNILRGALSGIYFKSADVLDKLAQTSTVVFSKTGTVTEGRYKVENVYAETYSERDLLMIAALAECQSQHPIAQALREACGIGITTRDDIHIVEELPSRGITTLFSGRNVYVGNASLLMEHGISFSIPPRNGTVIHVAVDSEYAGHIVLSDRIRDGAFDAIEELRLRGAGESVMLTGDVRSTSRQIASSLNFDLVKSELTPDGKISAVEYLKASKGNRGVLTYISSSEADLPILEHADIAFAFSALGKNKLLENADIMVPGENMFQVPGAYALSRKAKGRAQQSLILYAAVKLLLMVLGITGVFSIWFAAFLDFLAAVAVLLNVTRK